VWEDRWRTSAHPTRLAFDQTVENVTGAALPPRSWTVQEQVIDVLHKAVYSVVTGIIADRWIPPVSSLITEDPATNEPTSRGAGSVLRHLPCPC